MDECESLDSELQEFQIEAYEAISQDDEDEVEELQNSLREVVKDQSVKPKVQCLMVDPSFSMVTVQSEDSGIVWETASSRCSTPWASETSSISEAYSMEGSGAAGKVTIIFDEDKIVRRKTKSGGRSSRLGDRLSRPGSSRCASALGVERPEMAEVSLPNVKQETSEAEPDLEEIKNKDQQLFSLISEGYEILNIRVPSKLPTVDEEESTELQDNLVYLDQTPQIKSRNHHDWTQQQNHVLPEEGEMQVQKEPSMQDSPQPSMDTELGHTATQKESTNNIDYFEKFTLLDEVVPGEQAAELQVEAEQPTPKPQGEGPKLAKETARDSLSASEESFVFVTDVEIVGEHLDEVFYGETPPADALQWREDEEEASMRTRRESQRSMKGSGSVLFESEETILTPIYISPGPPKIIDPILLEEPTAMSFMYSDLYEDAVGERSKSDEEYSEAESVVSEKSYKRRLSDSEEADGYLEKFILKDETPTVEVQPESVEEEMKGRMMWSQSKFEMTGCLTRVVEKGKEEEDKKRTEEPVTPKISGKDTSDDLESEAFQQKGDKITEKDRKKIHLSIPEEQAVTDPSGISIQDSKLREGKMRDQEIEVKRDQTDPPESSSNEPYPAKVEKTGEGGEHQKGEECTVETEQLCQMQKGIESTKDVHVTQTAIKSPVNTEVLASVVKSEIQTEITEAKAEALADVKEPESVRQEILTLTEPSGETETSCDNLQCEGKKAAKVVQEDVAPVDVITDCDSEVHAVVEITEKAVSEKEMQTQVHIDLQQVTSIETTDVHKGDKDNEALIMGTAGSKLPELISETDQEFKTENLSVIKPVMSDVNTDSHQKHHEILQSEQHQQEDSVTDCESDKAKLITEVKATISTGDIGVAVKERVNVGNELILLVPKGQSIEMDVNIDQWLDKTASVLVAPPEPVNTPKDTTEQSETLQEPMEETKTEPPLEVEAEDGVKEEELPGNYLNRKCSSPAPVAETHTEEQKTKRDLEEGEGLFSPLSSFTPLEDLSKLHREILQSEEAVVEQETDRVKELPETKINKEHVGPDVNLYREDIGQKREEGEMVTEASEVPVDEFEYEIISKEDAKEIPESIIQTELEESKRESDEDRDEGMEVELEMGEKILELIEADYEIIDAEEESQARLAAELLGMDWFCLTCGCLLSENDHISGEHHSHNMKAVDKAYEEIKEKLSGWISDLQGRSENIEDLVSELELAYNSVEDHCRDSEGAMQAQNEEMMALVMEQYNNMSVSMEEEKKAKLEQLYDQIVSFQESIDSAKATLETTAREAETDARSPEDICARLEAALDSTISLELCPKGLLVFDDCTMGSTSSSHLAQHKGIPVAQRPTVQPQEQGSATSTSVTVYWKVNPEDIINCFQVYCMEDPQGAVSEEYRVTVKESYCVLEELEPDRKYKVWVMAVNHTGCSLPSERLTFRTAPSVPVFDTEHCSIMWDSAMLRWNSEKQSPGQSYTLEYCRQYELEGEGLRSISGINSCEQRVLLQPNESYLFYIKAVNEAGASEQSEAALISTKGTRFHLLKDTAHPALELSVDETTMHYSQDTYENMPLSDKQCPSILGELLPARGRYYWETTVSGNTAYRLGVTCSADNRNSALGENRLSWCLQCIPTPSGYRYQLLHNDVQSNVFVIEIPDRVGTLLDYQRSRLSFYNAQNGQLLSTFSQHFTQPCHAAFALEMPGSLEVCMVLEMPKFTKDS
ncbi:Cardiomyopathy-associated protein 5 [Channa argus]|uniref:Cardiomyopathy-associated protein 5 n=1 Tax=Channa argus TaxID=215402 RepID=A0A6G1Q0U2_CHAAH|nr:Cardiomyopathy-associated protein 5 [Channa argus]